MAKQHEMQSAKLTPGKPGPSTVQYLDIAEIRDDVVIMKDGTLRAVLLVSSINFALKSEEEQEAVIQAYMSFLNGLEYPIQVVIQSRRMNIEPYILRLRETQRGQSNELLRAQIDDYVSFIQELVSLGDIMSKRFFVVVPYSPGSDKKQSFWTRLSAALSAASVIKLQDKQFQEYKNSLALRVGQVAGSLSSMSLSAVQLDTQGLIELYYGAYNPDTGESQKLTDISALRIED